MPALGTVHKSRIVYRDSTGETSAMEIYNDAITAVSIAGFLTQFGALQTATDAITLGERFQQAWIGDLTTVSNAVPANQAAQREAKLLVQYQGTTSEKPYTLTIPTIDFATLVFLPGGGDAVAFTDANGASAGIQAWVTAFEAIASAPDDPAENVVVTGMRFVGRNS